MDKKPIEDVAKFKTSDEATLEQSFLEKLQATLQDIFDAEKPFEPTPEKERCTYCEYKNICGR
jgi:CRISPR/Cas system-associated exonuclease Cas4 (RecB family)